MNKIIQKLDPVEGISFNWKLKGDKDMEIIRKSREAWRLIDEINTQRQVVKYTNSSKFSQIYENFQCFFKRMFNY